MRKPRDIDAELRELARKTKDLKTRKVVQLGELVIATGAAELDAEHLAGVLISAIETQSPETTQAWKTKGAAFFRKSAGRAGAAAKGDPASAGQGPRHDAAG